MAQNYLSYTSRDFESIKADLVNAIPNLTDIWTSREEADPGMVLITLMAALGDNLSFNMDQQSLEFYGKTFTQRKSAARVLDLIGYQLHWYKSATLEVTVYNNNPTAKAYLVFNPTSPQTTHRLISSTIGSAPAYFLLNPEETPANWNSNTNIEIPAGGSKTLQAVQGTLASVSFDASAIDINNRYYISNTKIDQNHMWLKDTSSTGKNNLQWYLVDNINNLTETAPRFQFGVDEYNLPYIELVPYWKSLYGESHTFTLYYLITRGSSGNVAANVLNSVASIASHQINQSRGIKSTDILVVHGSNTTPNTNLNNVPGADPQTAKEAYWDSRNYIGVYNTLVTLLDFEKYMLRQPLISAVRAVDGQYSKEYNETIPDEEAYNRIYPVNYISDSFILTDSTSTYSVIPYKGTDVHRTDELETILPYGSEDCQVPGSWFKGDTHIYRLEKTAGIVQNGGVDIGSLRFTHDGSAGDLRAGLIPPKNDLFNGLGTGTRVLSFSIHLENIPEVSRIKTFKLLVEEPGFESHATDLIPALLSDKGLVSGESQLSSALIRYNEDLNDFSNGFPHYTTSIQTYGSDKYYFRCIFELMPIKGELVTIPENPISVYLDNIEIRETRDTEDLLTGIGCFRTGSVKAELHEATINNTQFIFNLSDPIDEQHGYTIHEYTTDKMRWTTVDSDIVTLPVSRTDGTGLEYKTFYFKQASSDFEPYNLQLHMVAGDFLIASASQNTFKYADESPVTVETTEQGPQGYISYQVGDAIVGDDEDSLISQTDFDNVRLFNTEIKYGPVRKFPFFIDGQIHLKAPVRPAEANLILSRVYAALQTYFNTYNLIMGEKITFNDVIAVIKSADEHIDYFDAGANNEHGSLFIYPTIDDYNPHDYNSSTATYGKYGVNINPKYFNDISLQHYEDLLQANNSIIYWGDTMSKHLSIAADSISEKSIPLTSGISAIISYKSGTGIVTPDPDVVNLYEYNIIRRAMADTEHKLITTNLPEKIVVRGSTNFQMPEGTAAYKYYADIPLVSSNDDYSIFEHSPAFRFSLNTENAPSRLFGWSKRRNSFAILDEVGIPRVTTKGSSDPFESSYFSVSYLDNQDNITSNKNEMVKLRITVEDPIIDVDTNTYVYYLMEYIPNAQVSYFNSNWSESNCFDGIKDIGITDTTDSQPFSILYETLNNTDHIWGRESLEEYIDLESVDCKDSETGAVYSTVYDRFDNGFVAALRSKETITSKPSSVIISNYAVYKDA